MNLMFCDMTVKQVACLSQKIGIKKYELWEIGDYGRTHWHTKDFLSHLIASKQIDSLIKMGYTSHAAMFFTVIGGSPRVNKKNLALLGSPMGFGHICELLEDPYWKDVPVDTVSTKGLFRKTIEIVVDFEQLIAAKTGGSRHI